MNHRAVRPSSRVRQVKIQQCGPDHSSATEDKAERERRLKDMTERAKRGLPLSKEK